MADFTGLAALFRAIEQSTEGTPTPAAAASSLQQNGSTPPQMKHRMEVADNNAGAPHGTAPEDGVGADLSLKRPRPSSPLHKHDTASIKCADCGKVRRIARDRFPPPLTKWHCRDNDDVHRKTCAAPDEHVDENEAPLPPLPQQQPQSLPRSCSASPVSMPMKKRPLARETTVIVEERSRRSPSPSVVTKWSEEKRLQALPVAAAVSHQQRKCLVVDADGPMVIIPSHHHHHHSHQQQQQQHQQPATAAPVIRAVGGGGGGGGGNARQHEDEEEEKELVDVLGAVASPRSRVSFVDQLRTLTPEVVLDQLDGAADEEDDDDNDDCDHDRDVADCQEGEGVFVVEIVDGLFSPQCGGGGGGVCIEVRDGLQQERSGSDFTVVGRGRPLEGAADSDDSDIEKCAALSVGPSQSGGEEQEVLLASRWTGQCSKSEKGCDDCAFVVRVRGNDEKATAGCAEAGEEGNVPCETPDGRECTMIVTRDHWCLPAVAAGGNNNSSSSSIVENDVCVTRGDLLFIPEVDKGTGVCISECTKRDDPSCELKVCQDNLPCVPPAPVSECTNRAAFEPKACQKAPLPVPSDTSTAPVVSECVRDACEPKASQKVSVPTTAGVSECTRRGAEYLHTAPPSERASRMWWPSCTTNVATPSHTPASSSTLLLDTDWPSPVHSPTSGAVDYFVLEDSPYPASTEESDEDSRPWVRYSSSGSSAVAGDSSKDRSHRVVPGRAVADDRSAINSPHGSTFATTTTSPAHRHHSPPPSFSYSSSRSPPTTPPATFRLSCPPPPCKPRRANPPTRLKFASQLALVKGYISSHGRLPGPRDQYNNQAVGNWIKTWRLAYRDKALDNEAIASLEAVDGWEWTARRGRPPGRVNLLGRMQQSTSTQVRAPSSSEEAPQRLLQCQGQGQGVGMDLGQGLSQKVNSSPLFC